jgi:hypothetical protein
MTTGLQRFTHTAAGRPIVKSDRLGPADAPACEQCGLPHVGCVDHQTDRLPLHPCGRHAIRGGDRCPSHGAAKGSVNWKMAQRRKVSAEVARLMTAVDVEPVDDAGDSLALTAGEAIAFKNLMAGKLADLARDDWRWASQEGAEQLHAYVALWERALDRVEKFLVPMAKLVLVLDATLKALADNGIDEERVEAIKDSIVAYLAPHRK